MPFVCGRIGGDPSFFTMRKTKRRKTKDKSCILSYVNVLDSITRDSTIPLPSGKERRTSVLIVAGYFLAIFIRTNFYPIDYIPFDRLYRNVISCCNDHVFYHRSKSNWKMRCPIDGRPLFVRGICSLAVDGFLENGGNIFLKRERYSFIQRRYE